LERKADADGSPFSGDGNPELKSGIKQVWPWVAYQRCTVHKLRNLLGRASEYAQEEVHEEYKRTIYGPN